MALTIETHDIYAIGRTGFFMLTASTKDQSHDRGVSLIISEQNPCPIFVLWIMIRASVCQCPANQCSIYKY